jgi:hypothetical protein
MKSSCVCQTSLTTYELTHPSSWNWNESHASQGQHMCVLSSFIPPLTSIWILQGTDVNILIFIDCEIKTSEVGVTLKHLNVKSEDLFYKNLYKICSFYYNSSFL